MPVNSIVVAACLEWMDRHTPDPRSLVMPAANLSVLIPAPRWATLRRAVEVAAVRRSTSGSYPFDRFTLRAKKMLTAAQLEATKAGVSYIGTEHLLLAALADPESHAGSALVTLGVTEKAVRDVKKVDQGKLPLNKMCTVRPETWQKWHGPAAGSTMFLSPGEQVSVENLLKGIVTLSGNDASVVLAECIAGTEVG